MVHDVAAGISQVRQKLHIVSDPGRVSVSTPPHPVFPQLFPAEMAQPVTTGVLELLLTGSLSPKTSTVGCKYLTIFWPPSLRLQKVTRNKIQEDFFPGLSHPV